MSDPGADLSTAPATPVVPIGFRGWLRWMWRALTSMRVALVLLFLLALASIPGSLFPQRGSKPTEVNAYLAAHPKLGPLLDRIGFFNVFGSAWFAAIYLLLFISLAGCVIPRTRLHLRALRARPPIAPAHPARLPGGIAWVSSLPLAELGPQVLVAAADTLRAKRWRTDHVELNSEVAPKASGFVSAEKGYARETGNLLFHVALLVLLVGIGIGSAFGWKGQVIVKEGGGFANTVTQYDTFTAGRLVNQSNLPPFTVHLDAFDITYQAGGPQNGEPLYFAAHVTSSSAPGASATSAAITANHPLGIGTARVYLIGHGYAPHVVVHDRQGKVVFDDLVVFLPQDGNFTSQGVAKIPDMTPQLGLQGIFLPTAVVDPVRGPISVFPAAQDPALFLSAWRGDLGLNSGVPQSVYRLDMTHLSRISIKALRPGDTWTLPDGSGTVTFAGVAQYATLSVADDPGKGIALASALTAVVGLMLSLSVRRRRLWVRVSNSGSGGTLIEVAGLTRADSTDISAELASLVEGLRGVAPETKE